MMKEKKPIKGHKQSDDLMCMERMEIMVYQGIEVCEKDGKVAILISPGFGAGWSTWGVRSLAYDKKVIEIFDKYPPKQDREGLENVSRELSSIGYGGTYMGGYNQIEKVWVDLEVPFRINEYDGSESIQYVDEIGLIQF